MNENCAQTERKRYYQCKWQKCIKNNNLKNLFDIRVKQNNQSIIRLLTYFMQITNGHFHGNL